MYEIKTERELEGYMGRVLICNYYDVIRVIGVLVDYESNSLGEMAYGLNPHIETPRHPKHLEYNNWRVYGGRNPNKILVMDIEDEIIWKLTYCG
jgi:hypothetical protein